MAVTSVLAYSHHHDVKWAVAPIGSSAEGLTPIAPGFGGLCETQLQLCAYWTLMTSYCIPLMHVFLRAML